MAVNRFLKNFSARDVMQFLDTETDDPQTLILHGMSTRTRSTFGTPNALQYFQKAPTWKQVCQSPSWTSPTGATNQRAKPDIRREGVVRFKILLRLPWMFGAWTLESTALVL
ncbi:MAG: hypothetical protein ACRER2_08410 [Methylococcales bacterium]